MANELSFGPALTGQTLSAIVFAQDGSSGTAALPEVSGTGLYLGDFPASPAGTYYVVVRDSSGVAVSMPSQVNWDGAQEVTPATASVTAGALSSIAGAVVTAWKSDPWEILSHAVESGATAYDPHAHTLTFYKDDGTVARVFSLHQTLGQTVARDVTV